MARLGYFVPETDETGLSPDAIQKLEALLKEEARDAG